MLVFDTVVDFTRSCVATFAIRVARRPAVGPCPESETGLLMSLPFQGCKVVKFTTKYLLQEKTMGEDTEMS